MCDGGGSDEADRYYEEQRAREAKRQAGTDETLETIRGMFDEGARDPIYQDQYDNALGLYMDDLQRQYEDAVAQMRIANSRSGNSAGSVGAGRQAELKQQHDRGVIEAQRLAQQMREGLYSADQSTKGSLIQQAYGGLGASDASDMALAALRSNENVNLRNSRDAGLGGWFDQLATGYQDYRKDSGVRQGQDEYNAFFSGNSSSNGGARVS